MNPLASSSTPAANMPNSFEGRELRHAAVMDHGNRQGHGHQQGAGPRLKETMSSCFSCSRYQPTWPTASSPMPAATEKISSSSQWLKWLSRWMAKNISAASVMAVTMYHRRQPGCRTSHAASKLSTARLASKLTNDQSRSAGAEPPGDACGSRSAGPRPRSSATSGRWPIERRLGQLARVPHRQAIADQEHQPREGEGERVVFREPLASIAAIARPQRRRSPHKDRRSRPACGRRPSAGRTAAASRSTNASERFRRRPTHGLEDVLRASGATAAARTATSITAVAVWPAQTKGFSRARPR